MGDELTAGEVAHAPRLVCVIERIWLLSLFTLVLFAVSDSSHQFWGVGNKEKPDNPPIPGRRPAAAPKSTQVSVPPDESVQSPRLFLFLPPF